MKNHWLLEGGGRWRERLGEVSAPTLVLHGTEDPMFPYGHALALAHEIPGARLVPLEGTGHEVPPREVWVIVVPAILQHTSGAAPADAAVSVTGYRVEPSVPGPLPPSGSPR
jgi:fermentation-respiration switch protein FrsA (DUF1100 family)